MERKFYKTPRTKLFSVELEGTFAGSAEVENTQEETGRIDHHGFGELTATDGSEGEFTFGGDWE